MPDFRGVFRRSGRFLQWTLGIVIVLFGIKYCVEVKARVHAGESPHRWTIEVSDIQQGAYTAKSTFIGRETVLLRLYRTGDSTLLAERVYTEHSVALLWTDGWLIYDTSLDDGAIQLPPTRLDRLLAKLP